MLLQKFEDSSFKERRVDQTRVDAEGLVEELLKSTDLKPVEQDECKPIFIHVSVVYKNTSII